MLWLLMIFVERQSHYLCFLSNLPRGEEFARNDNIAVLRWTNSEMPGH